MSRVLPGERAGAMTGPACGGVRGFVRVRRIRLWTCLRGSSVRLRWYCCVLGGSGVTSATCWWWRCVCASRFSTWFVRLSLRLFGDRRREWRVP
eukprot:contig_1579_g239